MNDEDLRDSAAILILNGMISARDWFGTIGRWTSKEEMVKTYAEEAYMFADALVEARKPKEIEGGIAAVKRVRKTK